MSARGLLKWMARATSSLPVPLSPRMSTVARLAQTSAICWSTAWNGGLLPIRLSKLYLSADLAAQPLVLDHRIRQFQRAIDGRHHVIDLEGLGDVVERTFLDDVDRAAHRCISRHDDDRQFGPIALDDGEQFTAASTRHPHIADDHVHAFGMDEAPAPR